jgi:O-antigen/teichoic acid export membrane protein
MYGNYKYVLSLATILGALSLSGLGDAVGQAAARGKDGALIQGFRTNLVWSGPFVLASLCVAAYYWLQGNPFVAGSMVVVAFCQPVAASSSYFASFLFGQRDFARGASYMIAESAITYGAVLAALLVGERAIMLVAAYFVSNAIASLYFTWKAQQHARNTEKDEGLFAFGAHLSVMNVIAVIADRFDSIIVFSLLGPAQLATYAFSIAAPEQLKGVIKNLYGLALPKFAGRPLAEIQRTVWPKLWLLTGLIAVAVVGYIVIAPSLFRLLFPLYGEAVPYTQWYALSLLFAGFPSVLSSALTAHKQTRALYMTTNAAPVALVFLLAVLVPIFGIAGAIASQIAYRAINASVHAWQFMHAKS